jgi:hypothetical protein
MLLAKDEVVIKNWDYAHAKQKRIKTTASLTVTNKRIVYTLENQERIDRQEVPLQDVKTIACEKRTASNFWPIVMIVFGALLSIVIVGIPLLIKGIRSLNQGSFQLEITTYGVEGSSLDISASKVLFRKKNRGRLSVSINREAAQEIVDTIGAIIIDNKAA